MRKKFVASLICALSAITALFSACNANEKSMKISIVNGESPISLNNSVIEEFVNGYEPFEKLGDLPDKGKDEYYPKPVTFSWKGSDGEKGYKFYISENADFTDSAVYETSLSAVTVDNLFSATTYYCRVEDLSNGKKGKTFSFDTKREPRTVRIDGVSNTRDTGGYFADGKEVKQGLVYRGANLDGISANGKKQFASLGIKTVIDLREASGRKQTLSGVNYIDLPENGGACYVYGDKGLLIKEYREALAQTVKAFANEENYPIYFHCQIGRDRTGTLAFVLNGLLGVDYDELVKDYELSFFSSSALLDYKEDLGKNLQSAIDNLYNYFLKVSTNKGADEPTLKDGIEKFLIEIGVTQEEIANIKRIMLK